MRSLLGSSTLTDFRDNLFSTCAQSGAMAAPAMRTIGSRARIIHSSSGDHDGGLLDDVAHEAARVPVGCSGLQLAAGAGAADHQRAVSPIRRVEVYLPLAETVFAFILAEIGLLPSPAAITGEVHARHARIATECDAARERW